MVQEAGSAKISMTRDRRLQSVSKPVIVIDMYTESIPPSCML